MSARREVAVDGVVRIPKSVFESQAPEPAAPTEVVATVRRIDGTVEELKRVTPDNPNFQPRKPTPGAVKAVNKDEALIAFHRRKGMPLPAELQSKAVELEKSTEEEGRRKEERAARFGAGGGGGGGGQAGGPGGGAKRKGGGAVAAAGMSEEDKARLAARSARFGGGAAGAGAAVDAPAATQPPPARKRPKGGIKLLSGVEGAVPVR